MIESTFPISYYQFSPGRWQTLRGSAIVERTVSLTVNNEVWLTFMCTPVDLEAMAVGFLYNEGLLKDLSEIADVRLCASGDNVDVWTTRSLERPERWRRTSGCTGGVTSVETDLDLTGENQDAPGQSGMASNSDTPTAEFPKERKIPNNVISPQQLSNLIVELFEGQTLYREAGGVHSSALSDGDSILVATEDIGRHNTLDKIAGRCLMEGITVRHGIILSTGRISSEMLQKADRLGAGAVVSRTAASSLAIQMADKLGITLIGYARRERFNVYTHPERITLPTRIGQSKG